MIAVSLIYLMLALVDDYFAVVHPVELVATGVNEIEMSHKLESVAQIFAVLARKCSQLILHCDKTMQYCVTSN